MNISKALNRALVTIADYFFTVFYTVAVFNFMKQHVTFQDCSASKTRVNPREPKLPPHFSYRNIMIEAKYDFLFSVSFTLLSNAGRLRSISSRKKIINRSVGLIREKLNWKFVKRNNIWLAFLQKKIYFSSSDVNCRSAFLKNIAKVKVIRKKIFEYLLSNQKSAKK